MKLLDRILHGLCRLIADHPGKVILVHVVIMIVLAFPFAVWTPGLNNSGVFLAVNKLSVRQTLAFGELQALADTVQAVQSVPNGVNAMLLVNRTSGGSILSYRGVSVMHQALKYLAFAPGLSDFCHKPRQNGTCRNFTAGKPLEIVQCDTIWACRPPSSPLDSYLGPTWPVMSTPLPQTVLSEAIVANTTSSLRYDRTQASAVYFGINFYADSLLETYTPTIPSLTSGTEAVRVLFQFGRPLKGFSDAAGNESKQFELLNDYVASSWAAAFDYARDIVKHGGEAEAYGTGQTLFQTAMAEIVSQDFIFASMAVFFVFALMLIQTRSFFMTSTGIFQILLSYVNTYFFYRFLGQLEIVPQLTQLALFILLGIGADDIFVYLDEWTRSHLKEEHVASDVFSKTLFTYRHSISAMFTTSLTTFVAFVATAISPIPAIRSFGVYTAVAVALNFLYCCALLPSLVVVYHRNFENIAFPPIICSHTGGWCLKFNRKPFPWEVVDSESTAEKGNRVSPNGASRDTLQLQDVGDDSFPPVVSADAVAVASDDSTAKPTRSLEPEEMPHVDHTLTDDYPSIKEHRLFERMFYFPIFTVVSKGRFAILLFALGLIGLTSWAASLVDRPTEQEIFTPPGHHLTKASELLSSYFSVSGSNVLNEMHLVMGVDPYDPVDLSGRDPNNEIDFGTANLLEYDFSSYRSQRMQAWVCNDLIYSHAAPDSANTSKFVQDTSNCVINHYRAWLKSILPDLCADPMQINECLVPPDYYAPLMKAFVSTPDAQALGFGEVVGFEKRNTAMPTMPASLKALNIDFSPRKILFIRQRLTFAAPFKAFQSSLVPWTESYHAWLAEARRRSDAQDMPIFLVTFREMWDDTLDVMAAGAVNGVIWSTLLGWLMLILSSGNVLVGTFAIASIACVLLAVFAMFVALGWQLGVVETIATTILVGVAVDYSVHYSHGYGSAPLYGRNDRSRWALLTMGVSVTSGAITTACSCIPLMFTQIQFFQKFGIFLFLTVALSWIFATFIFMSLCCMIGPEGTWCSSAAIVSSVVRIFSREKPGDEDKPGNVK